MEGRGGGGMGAAVGAQSDKATRIATKYIIFVSPIHREQSYEHIFFLMAKEGLNRIGKINGSTVLLDEET